MLEELSVCFYLLIKNDYDKLTNVTITSLYDWFVAKFPTDNHITQVEFYHLTRRLKTSTGDYSIQNLQREQLGFVPLGEYEAYLENELSNSEFSKKIIQRFDTINQLHQYYEDFSITFDSMSEILNESNPHKYIKSIYYSNALLCCVFSLRSTEKGADYGK